MSALRARSQRAVGSNRQEQQLLHLLREGLGTMSVWPRGRASHGHAQRVAEETRPCPNIAYRFARAHNAQGLLRPERDAPLATQRTSLRRPGATAHMCRRRPWLTRLSVGRQCRCLRNASTTTAAATPRMPKVASTLTAGLCDSVSCPPAAGEGGGL